MLDFDRITPTPICLNDSKRKETQTWFENWKRRQSQCRAAHLMHTVPCATPRCMVLAYDYTVNYTLTQVYFEKLHAPVKGFYTFEKSAHSPIFDEPKKVQIILVKDVLEGTNDLADPK